MMQAAGGQKGDLDHTALLRQLPEQVKVGLTVRSDWPGILHLLGHIGLIAALGWAILAKVPFWPALMLPQGILLVFLFNLSHECTHQTPFRTVWINEALGHASGVVLALPFIWFRYFHLAHHKHTNDPENDPELAHGGRPGTVGRWVVHLSGWGYWRAMLGTLFTNGFGRIDAPYLPKRRHSAMRTEARVILGLYLLAALSLFLTPALLWIWIVPAIIGQPFLRTYLLAEHGLCPAVANMLENSRTTFTNRAVRYLAWNMPYHAEHHALPNAPFHKLPALHALTRDHLKSTSPGYAAFTADYVRRLER